MATGELTAEVIEEVADNLEEAAVAVRKIDAKAVGFLLIGVGVGIGVGFFIGYRYNREKLRAEAFRQSEEEVEKIRELYREARVIEVKKPSAEKIVEERGYSTEEVEERPLPAPVPIHEPMDDLIRRNVGTARTEEAEKDKHDGWSYPYELSQRSPNEPYIIHQDEFATNETEYAQVTYTYYAGDDVLTDEDDTVINNRATLIGRDVLLRFGHGTDDFNILYVRNSHLELEFEICRVPKSYEQEVQGLEDETSRNEDNSD